MSSSYKLGDFQIYDDLEKISSKDIENYIPINKEIDSEVFSSLLDENKVVASYKMYWLLGILDEVALGNLGIPFKRLIARMIVYAWYPHQQYKLYFGASDNLKTVINYTAATYDFSSNCEEKQLLEFFCSTEDKEINKMMKELTYNVPYRLLSPFFVDELNRIQGNLNNIITNMSLNSDTCLYKIVKVNEDKIVINHCWEKYLKENYRVIKAWIYYKLVCFLQKRNSNVPAIAFKLEAPKSRNLAPATKLWRKIIEVKGIKDIYTGMEFNEGTFNEHGTLSIDHFIPWSFVLHDEMWNLVPTFKRVNSTKSDKLLPFDVYINDFCHIQYKAFSYICENKINAAAEDYMDILRLDNPYNYYKCTTPEDFSTNIKQCISPLYQIAVNQGFQVVNKIFY